MSGSLRVVGPQDELTSTRLGEVYVLLQMECELKCKVCPYWGVRGACRDEAFRATQVHRHSPEVLERFIDQILPYRPRTLTLSGGEPLASPDWVRVAAYAKSKGLGVALSTNGLHIPKYYDEIFDTVDNIQLSLGGTKEILREVRSATFGFDEVLDALAELSARKKARGLGKPFLRIIYVVSDLSFHRVQAFYDLFQERGIEIDSFYYQHVIYIDDKTLQAQKEVMRERGMGSRLWESYHYDPRKVDCPELLRQMDALSGCGNVFFSPRLSREEVPLYYAPERKGEIERRGRCRAPWTQLDLYPNGDLTVCPDYILGNIHEHSVEEIWNGARARELRQLVLDRGGFPGCNACFYYYVSQEESALQGLPAGAGTPRPAGTKR